MKRSHPAVLPGTIALAVSLLLAGHASATPELSRAQALAAISAQASNKIDAKFMARVIDAQSADVVVEYYAAAPFDSGASSNYQARLAQNVARFSHSKQQVAADFAINEIQNLREFDALPMNFVRVKTRSALVRLLNHSSVKAVHENKMHQHTLAQSLPLIRQPQALAQGYQGAGTTVVVLDTGADYRDPAFGSCSAPGTPASCRVVAALDTAPNDGQLDDDGHGSNVAGIVAGVAPGTRIAAIDVFNGANAATADIISGINWAINNKAQHNIVAMNLSLGVRGSKYNSECASSWATTPFANARAAGIITVVAAGNDGFADGVEEPACAPGAVRVGAVYDSNFGAISFITCSDASTAADRITCFSNSGNLLTLLAPGSVIDAANRTASGTSQAAPHVAGAIAVLRANNAGAGDSLDQTMARLINTGVKITDPRNNLTRPRIDLLAAVNTFQKPTNTPPWLTPVMSLLLDD